jgi:hypothetical protein
VLTGSAAVGIDPTHFNLQFGIAATMHIGMAAAVINSVIGVAAYLQKSPCLKEICSGGFMPLQRRNLFSRGHAGHTDRKVFPDFTDATSPVLIRNAQQAIAYATAALAGWARGSPLAERWDEAASDALEDLVVQAVRRKPQSSRRRLPFSSRSGYNPF